MAQHSYSSSDSDVGLHQRQSRKAELSEAFINYRKGEFDPKLDAALKRKGRKILESYDPEKRKKSKINPHSIFWMVASMALFYYTDFYIAVRIDPRIDWTWLIAGISFLLVTFSIAAICIIWFHCIKGIRDYENQFPLLVPLATISFFAGMLSCCVAMWSVWGWFTPIILFTFFMGMVFAASVVSL